MTVTPSPRRKQKTLTTTTKTTASPSSPKIGDLVRFTDERHPDWVGQEGVVVGRDGEGVSYRVTKAAPTSLGKRWNTVGDTRSNFVDQITVITEHLKPAEEDVVNHPSHYTRFPVEVIELTRHLDFCRGNAVKYIARAGFKGGPEKELEDLEKAEWYIKDAIEQVKKKLNGLG
jgi:hypothetical protein